MVASQVPGALSRVHHVIDYLGTLVLSAAATSLILLTSLGGTTYPWKSTPIYILGAAGIVLIGLFVLVERRAVEPVLPLHLFRLRTFSTTSIVGFIVGFAMFGAITYLPAFFQVVRGISPTISGVYLLPLMAGLLVTSIGSGQVISRTGRYRFFPIVGTALMTLGLFLLHLMGVHTSTFLDAMYMLVLGLGLGSVMQVLVIIVQNGVPHSELGVATSGATFFRSIGGSFGTAIFGAIFSNVLVGNLASHLHGIHLPAGFSAADATPALLGKLPAVVHAGFVAGYAESIQTVFIVAVPIAALAFLATWFIPQVELKQWPEPNADAAAPEGAMTVPGATVAAEVLDQPGSNGTTVSPEILARPGSARTTCPANPSTPRTRPPTPDRPAVARPRRAPARRGLPVPAARPGPAAAQRAGAFPYPPAAAPPGSRESHHPPVPAAAQPRIPRVPPAPPAHLSRATCAESGKTPRKGASSAGKVALGHGAAGSVTRLQPLAPRQGAWHADRMADVLTTREVRVTLAEDAVADLRGAAAPDPAGRGGRGRLGTRRAPVLAGRAARGLGVIRHRRLPGPAGPASPRGSGRRRPADPPGARSRAGSRPAAAVADPRLARIVL